MLYTAQKKSIKIVGEGEGGGEGMLVCAGGGEGREWDKTLGPSIIAFSTLSA